MIIDAASLAQLLTIGLVISREGGGVQSLLSARFAAQGVAQDPCAAGDPPAQRPMFAWKFYYCRSRFLG